MKDPLYLDGIFNTDKARVCGNAVFGSDSGTCSGCRKHRELMPSGFCISCCQTHGIHVFSTRADALECLESQNQE